jgi:hypothetical protein
VQSIERQFVTVIAQASTEKTILVLECISETERNALYSALVCLFAQANKLFNPEALQIIQISSANFKRKKASTTPSAGMRAFQEADATGISKNAKKVAHTNKLNHSTMKTLAAMGHFDAAAGVDQVLEGGEGDQQGGDRSSDGVGRSPRLPVSEEGGKSEKRSAISSEEGADTFSQKPLPTFTPVKHSRDPSLSQNIDYGQIYRGASKELDISDEVMSPGARPSLLAMGSSSYKLTANPLSRQREVSIGGGDGEEDRPPIMLTAPGVSTTSRSSMDSGSGAARRTSVTMAGIGKTQQPINIKGRRKSVIK